MDVLEQIVRDEGCILHAYQDSEGYWTIGSGILIDERKGGGITQEESDYLTKNRIEERTIRLSSYSWFRALDEVREAVILNMAYNLGVDGLLKFEKMLAAVEKKDWTAASFEMMNSSWASQVKDRAIRLSQQMLTGAWR